MENRTTRNIRTAIVTGPTGAIGVALSELLLQNKVTVYAVCRPDSPRMDVIPDGVHLVECDLAQLEQLPRLLQGTQADAFFHLGWAKTVGAGRNDMDAQIKNVQYTLDACRAAKKLGCQVFVGAGSQAEYGRCDHALTPVTPCFPENGYGMAKLCAGQMSRVECQRLGIAHIWPRILSVYGPYDGENSMISQVITKLLAGEKPSLTAGEQMWDYLYSGDAARALFALARSGRDGSIYPLGSGEVHPLREYIEVLRDVIDPSLSLGFGEVPYGEKQVMYLEADVSELEKEAGYSPQTPFEDGIQLTIEWVKANHV